MTSQVSPVTLRDLLRQRDFCLYTAGDLFSLIGNWTQRITVGWLTWEMTGSATWLGLIAFMDLFPSVVLSPLGGVIVDRGDPRRISLITHAMAMLHACILLMVSMTGLLDIWLLAFLVAIRGSIAAINQPARLSLVPSLVPRGYLPMALAANSVVFNLARFVGPAVAGVVIVQYGVSGAFALNALSYLGLLLALMVIDVSPPVRDDRARSFASQVVAGYEYVSQHQGLRPLLIIFATGTVLVRPIIELLPGFADGIFNAGASGLAWFTSAMGVGAMLGGLIMIRRSALEQTFGAVGVSLGIMCISAILFSLAPSFWIALMLLVVLGGAISVNGIGTQALIQAAVENDMRGRVMSLYGMLFRGAPAVGALVMGTAADYVGLRWPMFVGAILCLGVWAWSLSRRNLMKNALLGQPPALSG